MDQPGIEPGTFGSKAGRSTIRPQRPYTAAKNGRDTACISHQKNSSFLSVCDTAFVR